MFVHSAIRHVLFGSLVVRIISGVYQCFIVLTFAGLIPIGFLIPNGF